MRTAAISLLLTPAAFGLAVLALVCYATFGALVLPRLVSGGARPPHSK
jgi:hypothetical protein